MIQVQDATKSFGQRTLWRGVDLTVGDREMVALTGPSGSGKSTLLNCIGLLETLDSGQVLVDGERITGASARRTRRYRRDRLGYLFQSYALIENATIRQNLDVVINDRGDRRAFRARQDEALEAVGLGGRAAEPVHRLSGGEQQRVALARLIVKRPTVILADEPTGALDDANQEMVMAHLRALARAGASVVVATHSGYVRQTCDRALDVTTLGRDAVAEAAAV